MERAKVGECVFFDYTQKSASDIYKFVDWLVDCKFFAKEQSQIISLQKRAIRVSCLGASLSPVKLCRKTCLRAGQRVLIAWGVKAKVKGGNQGIFAALGQWLAFISFKYQDYLETISFVDKFSSFLSG